jgi:hypothetical protein
MKVPSDIPEKTINDSSELAVGRAQELRDFVFELSSQESFSEFHGWLDEFTDLLTQFPMNTELEELFITSLIKFLQLFGKKKLYADMLFVLDEGTSFHEDNLENEKVTVYYARMLYQSIYYLRGSWDMEGTSILLKNLRDLKNQCPKNEEILGLLAKSYTTAINRRCSKRYNFFCEKLMFEMRMLANKYQDDQSVQYEFARALISIIGVFARENKKEELDQSIDQLQKIVNKFPDDDRLKHLLNRGSILSSLSSSNKK